MSGHHPFEKLRAKMSPVRRARNARATERLLEEMTWSELRRAREMTQIELARLLNINQPAVAKLENRTDMYVSNLRRYVEALGGSLEITVRFAEGAITIRSFAGIAEDSIPATGPETAGR